MALFYTDKSAKAEIAELNTRVEALTADGDSAQETIQALQTESADLKEQVSTLTTDHAAATVTLTEERDAATASLTEAQAELVTANAKLAESVAKQEGFDDKLEAGVLAKFEGLGGQPIPASDKHDGKTDFSKLTGLAKATAIHKQPKK